MDPFVSVRTMKKLLMHVLPDMKYVDMQAHDK